MQYVKGTRPQDERSKAFAKAGSPIQKFSSVQFSSDLMFHLTSYQPGTVLEGIRLTLRKDSIKRKERTFVYKENIKCGFWCKCALRAALAFKIDRKFMVKISHPPNNAHERKKAINVGLRSLRRYRKPTNPQIRSYQIRLHHLHSLSSRPRICIHLNIP